MAIGVSNVLWFCFFLSGAAALALEVLWMRSAALVLGQTTITTATVLASYFAGLAFGAAAARRAVEQPVRTYGLLELGASCGAWLSLAMFRVLSTDGAQAWLAAAGTAGGVAAIAFALLPSTLCLGATLPVIGQALATRDSVGRRGGWLYSLNTLGGVAGCAAIGFGLPALIGVTACYAITAGVSALAGILALLTAAREQRTREFPHPASTPTDLGMVDTRLAVRDSRPLESISTVRLRAAAAGAGALGLGLEVVWTRLFAQVLHNSVYSFTAIAIVYLFALAAGAAIAALLLRRVRPSLVAAGALIVAGLWTVGGMHLFTHWTDGLTYFGMRSGLGEYLVRIVALAAATVGPVALASGAVMPALWSMWKGDGGPERPLGDLSAANMLGGIAGVLLAGFAAMQLLGIRITLLVAALVYIVFADLLTPARARWRPLTYGALLAVAVLNPLALPLTHLSGESDLLRATFEGSSGIVTVVDSEGDLQLRLDNYYLLGGSAAATTERRLGLIPLLLHPEAKRVAFVGVATGITASAATALGVNDTTAVEIVPEVASAARTFFAPWNAHVLERSDVHLVIGDGRRYLASSRDHFDVIVSDLFIPWHQGAGNLYSREMYATIASRLGSGGLFCQWLPLYQLTRDEFAIIARTFLAVFPHATLWRADFFPDRPVLGLIGQLEPRILDPDDVHRRLQQLPAWSSDGLLSSVRGLEMLYVGDLRRAADLIASTPLNTDDHPLIEFTAPRLTRVSAVGEKDWFTGEALADFNETVSTRSTDGADSFFPISTDFNDARRAGAALYRYALATRRGDEVAAAQREADVRALVPDVVAGADGANAPDALADANRELVRLRAEQDAVQKKLEEMQQKLQALGESQGDGS